MRCGTHYTVYTCLKLNADADSVLVDYGVDTCIVDTSRMQRVVMKAPVDMRRASTGVKSMTIFF